MPLHEEKHDLDGERRRRVACTSSHQVHQAGQWMWSRMAARGLIHENNGKRGDAWERVNLSVLALGQQQEQRLEPTVRMQLTGPNRSAKKEERE